MKAGRESRSWRGCFQQASRNKWQWQG